MVFFSKLVGIPCGSEVCFFRVLPEAKGEPCLFTHFKSTLGFPSLFFFAVRVLRCFFCLIFIAVFCCFLDFAGLGGLIAAWFRCCCGVSILDLSFAADSPSEESPWGVGSEGALKFVFDLIFSSFMSASLMKRTIIKAVRIF